MKIDVKECFEIYVSNVVVIGFHWHLETVLRKQKHLFYCKRIDSSKHPQNNLLT